MGSKVHSRWRHLATQFAIFGLLVRVVLAAAMAPMPLLLTVGAAATPLAHAPIVVCTGTGFKLVSVDPNGSLVEKPLGSSACPICDALAAAAFAVEPVQADIVVAVSHTDIVLPSNAHIPASLACLAHRNHGPPPART